MAYHRRIERAVAYIEANLDREIRAKDVAREAAYSLFHFHRIFLATSQRTLMGYIRMRRLTLAARALVDGEDKIINIALDHGFESQESFTRAFKKAFGITPGRYRRQQMHYPTVYRNRLNINRILGLSKGEGMTPQIIEKKGFKMVGLRYFGDNAGNEIPGVWHEFLKRAGEVRHLGNPAHYYGLCTTPEPGADQEAGSDGSPFEYIAGREVDRLADIPQGMVGREVPDGRYAVFTHKGSLERLQETYGVIYGQWAKTRGSEMIQGSYDFEFYNEQFCPSVPESSELYIYIPIKNK